MSQFLIYVKNQYYCPRCNKITKHYRENLNCEFCGLSWYEDPEEDHNIIH